MQAWLCKGGVSARTRIQFLSLHPVSAGSRPLMWELAGPKPAACQPMCGEAIRSHQDITDPEAAICLPGCPQAAGLCLATHGHLPAVRGKVSIASSVQCMAVLNTPCDSHGAIAGVAGPPHAVVMCGMAPEARPAHQPSSKPSTNLWWGKRACRGSAGSDRKEPFCDATHKAQALDPPVLVLRSCLSQEPERHPRVNWA